MFGDDTAPTGAVSSRKREGCVSERKKVSDSSKPNGFIRIKEKLTTKKADDATMRCDFASPPAGLGQLCAFGFVALLG